MNYIQFSPWSHNPFFSPLGFVSNVKKMMLLFISRWKSLIKTWGLTWWFGWSHFGYQSGDTESRSNIVLQNTGGDFMAKVMTVFTNELWGTLHSCLNYKISNHMTTMKVQVTDGLYSIVLLCFTGLLFFVSELICFLKLSTRATCFPILLIMT